MLRLAGFWVVLCLLVSCNKPASDHSDKMVFRYCEFAGITSLDPAYANNQANIWACNHLFNGLIVLDESLHPRPAIAKSWEISEDGRTYTFHLRSDILFHDDPLFKGRRFVKASDAVFSFQRIAEKDATSPGSWIFNNLERNPDGAISGLSAVNDTTLVIRLSRAFPPFLGLMGSAYAAIVPPEIVQHYGKDFRTHPIGTGPFKFKQWVERTALILHKNPDYFEFDSSGNRLPYLDAVDIGFISDKQSIFMEFLRGKLDFVSAIDASYKDDLLTPSGQLRSKYKGRIRMETAPYLNTEYLGILCDSSLPAMKGSPLNNILIRQAINYGFDRERMIRYLRNGMATPGTGGLVPGGLPGFEKTASYGYHYDPDKAKELLKQAGYPNGKGLPAITMSTTGSYQDLCEFIQGQLAEIGIRIILDVNQAAQHRQMVAKQSMPFFRASWIADYADAENYLSLLYSPNKAPAGPNYTHFSDATYDQLYDQAMMQANDSLRERIYRQMDSLAISKAPVVVLYYDKIVRLLSPAVSGLTMNPLNLLDLRRVKIKKGSKDLPH